MKKCMKPKELPQFRSSTSQIRAPTSRRQTGSVRRAVLNDLVVGRREGSAHFYACLHQPHPSQNIQGRGSSTIPTVTSTSQRWHSQNLGSCFDLSYLFMLKAGFSNLSMVCAAYMTFSCLINLKTFPSQPPKCPMDQPETRSDRKRRGQIHLFKMFWKRLCAW